MFVDSRREAFCEAPSPRAVRARDDVTRMFVSMLSAQQHLCNNGSKLVLSANLLISRLQT